MPVTVQPVLLTRDVGRLVRFYAELLGAEQSGRVPPEGPAFYVGLRVDGAEIGLVADDEAPAGSGQRTLLSVGVQGLDGYLDRVEDLGGRVLGPPREMPWGQRVAHVQDPDGNAVDLTEPV